jgi:hypothetical protein
VFFQGNRRSALDLIYAQGHDPVGLLFINPIGVGKQLALSGR